MADLPVTADKSTSKSQCPSIEHHHKSISKAFITRNVPLTESNKIIHNLTVNNCKTNVLIILTLKWIYVMKHFKKVDYVQWLKAKKKEKKKHKTKV